MKGVLFPSVTGKICSVLRAGLVAANVPYSPDVTVQPKVPAIKVARMVTVRDDGGSDDGPQSRRRYGFNVWAGSAIEAEKLSLLCMAILRGAADGKPITLVNQMSGPVDIEDEPRIVVAGAELSHYFFSCGITVRGTNF